MISSSVCMGWFVWPNHRSMYHIEYKTIGLGYFLMKFYEYLMWHSGKHTEKCFYVLNTALRPVSKSGEPLWNNSLATTTALCMRLLGTPSITLLCCRSTFSPFLSYFWSSYRLSLPFNQNSANLPSVPVSRLLVHLLLDQNIPSHIAVSRILQR